MIHLVQDETKRLGKNTSLYMQGKALPLSVFGLLQHETKLSVVNFSVRKASSFEDPVPNKAELLLLTGIRSAWALLHSVTHDAPAALQSSLMQVSFQRWLLPDIVTLSSFLEAAYRVEQMQHVPSIAGW